MPVDNGNAVGPVTGQTGPLVGRFKARFKWTVPFLAAVAVLLGACSDDGRTSGGPISQPSTPPEARSTGTTGTPSPGASPSDRPAVTRGLTPGPKSSSGSTRMARGTTTAPPSADPTRVAADEGFFPVPPDRDLYGLAAALVLKTKERIPRVVNRDPVSYAEGRVDTFWLTDIQNVRVYSSQATLALVSPRAYWYVEEGVSVSRSDLEKASRAFEEQIYPRVTAAFGTEWVPGVDNDPRLTIVHARLRGVEGYFSSADEYPTAVHQHSNQREMVYMASGLKVGSREYLAVLAHELQHAVHWNADPSEETWVNEGLAEVATGVAGYDTRSPNAFLRSSGSSLVNWPVENAGVVYYSAGNLFFDYLMAHYGTEEDLARLLSEPADGIRGVDAYLAGLGYDATFRDVFRDWTVANYLDAPSGPYGYPDRDVKVQGIGNMDDPGTRSSSVSQYAAEYTSIGITRGDVVVRFQGLTGVPLLPDVPADGGCWWSNRGDSISSTLTRELDLSPVGDATLRYRVWFDVEEDWDYGYLQVSTDGGETWDIVATPSSSPRNPVGNSFGPGYTGRSEGWVDEEVDLGSYAGHVVRLRFNYVTDDAINGLGFCVAGLSLSGGDVLDLAEGWESEGFAWVDGPVPQEYIVQVIEVGDETTVREIELDSDNRGEMLVTGLGDLDDLVVVVAALAPKTLTPADYTLVVDRPS